MPYSVYVLQNPTGKLYVGSTGDIERRLQEHQQDWLGGQPAADPGDWFTVWSSRLDQKP